MQEQLKMIGLQPKEKSSDIFYLNGLLRLTQRLFHMLTPNVRPAPNKSTIFGNAFLFVRLEFVTDLSQDGVETPDTARICPSPLRWVGRPG